MLEKLPNGEPFPFNYSSSRIDRNALFALNTEFDPRIISATRTEYHRARLNIDDLKADLMQYDCPKPSRHVQPSYYMALESVRQDLKLYKTKIIPLTTGAVAKHPDFPGAKSPGLPWKTRGYKTKSEAVNDPAVLDEIRKVWYRVEQGHDVELPDVACYARAQISKRDKNKVRATWGYSLTLYLAEGAYFYPILDKLKNEQNPIIAYGTEIATGGMNFINDMVTAFPTLPILMGDWSRMDKTIPAWLIRDAFKIIAEAIDWSHVIDVDGKIWPVRENRSKRRWNKLVNYFIDTPIRLSNGERYMKHSGVPSGACFTNVIDSIVNAIAMRYITYETTGSLPIADIYLGDDSVIVLPTKVDLEHFSALLNDEFGLVFNAQKSFQTYNRQNVHFLGYYNDSGFPDKPIETIVASTIYPERPVRNKIETITRMVGQAYSCFNGRHAQSFFRCAKLLMEEEQLTEDDINIAINTHPYQFKYLKTIGIDPTTIVFRDPGNMTLSFDTAPSICRRKWKFRSRDLDSLYASGLKWFNINSEEDD